MGKAVEHLMFHFPDGINLVAPGSIYERRFPFRRFQDCLDSTVTITVSVSVSLSLYFTSG